jgi:AraC family transcriptional regulator
VLARRLNRARELLRTTSQPLGEIALACGFYSGSHFTNRFRQSLGGTPGEYRQAFLR